MGKRICALLLALALAVGCGGTALCANEYELYVDGAWVEHSRSVMVDGIAYAAAFFVVRGMYPDAVATWENEGTMIRAEGLELFAKPGEKYIVANGRYLYVSGGIRSEEGTGNTLAPVVTLAKAMGAGVYYDWTGVYLTYGTGPIESGETFYNAEDLDLIARVIRHEAGNQSLEGMMGVGNVILHRVADKAFPDTVSGVLYQKNQFTGATNCRANAASILAAKLCMDGGDVVPGAYWFNGVGRSFWASRNKTHLYTIDDHAFYG